MRVFFINALLVILLSTFILDTMSGLMVPEDASIEMNDDQKDEKKENENEKNQSKDKIFSNSQAVEYSFTPEAHRYLSFSFLLTAPYLSRIELPPDLA